MIQPITENTKSIIKLNNINANKGKNKLWKFIINSELKIATKTSIEDKPIKDSAIRNNISLSTLILMYRL